MATITLTTPFDPGDLAAGGYAELKIISCRILPIDQTVELVCEYGDTIASVWTPGVVPRKTYYVTDTDFTTIEAELPDGGEALMAGTEREFYQWLIDQGHYSGTIS